MWLQPPRFQTLDGVAAVQRGEGGCGGVHTTERSAWARHPWRSGGNVQLLPPTRRWERRGWGFSFGTRRRSSLQQERSQSQRVDASFWQQRQHCWWFLFKHWKWRNRWRGSTGLHALSLPTCKRAARHWYGCNCRRGVWHCLHNDGGCRGLRLYLRLPDGQIPERAKEEATANGGWRGWWRGQGWETDLLCCLKEWWHGGLARQRLRDEKGEN